MKAKRTLNTLEDYKKTSAINSMKLIRLVRSYDTLYNCHAEGYNDKNHKDLIWERINQALFPKYATLDEEVKEVIRVNVRRRWKTLRNSIARELKKTATVENYCRKKESPIISELEFLIPHIKSVYGTKFTEEMDLREEYSYSNEPDDVYDDDLDDLIDLTEEFDIKPIIKSDLSSNSSENSEDIPENMSTDALYPTIHMNVSTEACVAGATGVASQLRTTNGTTESGESVTPTTAATVVVPTTMTTIPTVTMPRAVWNNEYCSVTEYKEDQFMNSTVLCSEHDNDDNTSAVAADDPKTTSTPLGATGESTRKRPRPDPDDPAELQAKILQLLSNLERRERIDVRLDQEANDEDRMFLLSLVSDLKRVPAAKKMVVKAEIATAIARAIQ